MQHDRLTEQVTRESGHALMLLGGEREDYLIDPLGGSDLYKTIDATQVGEVCIGLEAVIQISNHVQSRPGATGELCGELLPGRWIAHDQYPAPPARPVAPMGHHAHDQMAEDQEGEIEEYEVDELQT